MQISNRKQSNLTKILPMALIGVGLIILGSLAFVYLSSQNQPATDYSVVPANVNFPAPDITLNNLAGQKVNIADYRQKVVLVNNWATWCPPCRAEMPTLVKYFKAHADDGFILIGIEAGDPANSVADFVDEFGITFPVLLDPNNRSLVAFHNDSLPSSYVIDRNGTVVLAWTGPINRAMLEKYITPLLEQ